MHYKTILIDSFNDFLFQAHVEESRERALKFEQQVKDEQLRFHELEVQSSVLQQKIDELQDVIDRGEISVQSSDKPAGSKETAVSSVKKTSAGNTTNKVGVSTAARSTTGGNVSVTTEQGK